MRISYILFTLILLVLSTVSNGESETKAQEIDKQTKQKDPLPAKFRLQRISDDYFFGKYLIYDCFGKFWACVDEGSFATCQADRKTSIDNMLLILSCAPFKKFDDPRDCVAEQEKQIMAPQTTEFCLHPFRLK